jgi:tRNA (guanosine-2'-O-)-methyltransferase
MPTSRRLQKFQSVLDNRQTDLTVICENIFDPHNVSAILRSCDAVGVSTVHLLYNNEPFPKLGKKSSASAKKWIDFKRCREPQELKMKLKEQNFIIYATALVSSAKSIFEIDWTGRSAIMVGNEHRGVSQEALNIADHTIYIPMFGMVESLNVSVATAVILFEICRQRMTKNRYPMKKDPRWLNSKLKSWSEDK